MDTIHHWVIPLSGFVHLHVHSHYSFFDGLAAPAELAGRARELDMPALALTDRPGLHGAVEFYRAAREQGIKPLIGCEVPVAGRTTGTAGGARAAEAGVADRLILLAADLRGYVNLSRLVTGAFLRAGPAPRTGPRVTEEELASHAQGLVALGTADHYRDVFGPGRYYLELAAGNPDSANRALLDLAGRLGLPVCATGPVHYLDPGQETAWLLVRAAGGRKAGGWQAGGREGGRHFRSPAEMARVFRDHPEALRNTLEIAAACNLDLPLGVPRLPRFPVPAGDTAEDYLRRLAEEGARRLYAGPDGVAGGVPDEVRARLDRELDVITARGLAGYFLVLWDLVRHARAQGIPVGPGRGSAAGSLVAYCLGITGVDPLAHGLFFERFLNPERPDVPDIDLDVCQRSRDDLIAYLGGKYGEDRVAQVATFALVRPRGAVRLAGRVLPVRLELTDRLARLLPERGSGLPDLVRTLPELARLPRDNPEVNALLTAAAALEGRPAHVGAHPAGVVIGPGPGPLADLVPLQWAAKGVRMTQYAMEDLEALGLPKLDILGLRNLTVIDDTLKALAARGVEIDLAALPPDDDPAFDLIGRGETVGCFQMESPGMRRFLRRFRPRHVPDLTAALSLYRPGPWDAGAVESYLRRRAGEEEAAYPHPVLADVLGETHGVLIYQEQVMRVAAAVAGFSLGEADRLRRALQRPDGEIGPYRERFLAGAEGRGIERAAAARIFALLERFAGYSFCKAHSVPYAHVSYWTAYLKARHPADYLAALLTAGPGYYAVETYLGEARRVGLRLLPGDVNRSGAGFRAEGPDAIRVGFLAVKGLGLRAIASILRARERDGPFRSLADFHARVGRLRPRGLENLAKAGFLAAIDPEAQGLTDEERAAREKEALGWSATRPLGGMAERLARAGVAGSRSLDSGSPGRRVVVAGRLVSARRHPARKGGPPLVLILEDDDGMFEVLVPADVCRRDFTEIDPAGVVVSGRLLRRDGEPLVVAAEIRAAADWLRGKSPPAPG